MRDEPKAQGPATREDGGSSAGTVQTKFGIGMAALALFLFGTVALAQHTQHDRIARESAETAREGSAPGAAARRGEPTTFDEGAAIGAMEQRLPEASRACNAHLRPGTKLTVRATFEPDGSVLRASVLTDLENDTIDACLANVLADTETPPFQGTEQTVEQTIEVFSH